MVEMSFLRKLFSLGGCARLSEDKDSDNQELPEVVGDDVNIFEDNGLLLHPEEMLSDRLRESSYIQRAWRSPSLGRRMVDRVRDSPRLARRAMNKMTSPLVLRRKKEDEIYSVTLHVVHSSEVVGRGEGRSDAW